MISRKSEYVFWECSSVQSLRWAWQRTETQSSWLVHENREKKCCMYLPAGLQQTRGIFKQTMFANGDLPSHNAENPVHVLVSRWVRSSVCLRAAVWVLRVHVVSQEVEQKLQLCDCVTQQGMAVSSLLPKIEAQIKTAKYGFHFLELTEHKRLSEGPPGAASLLQETGNTFRHLRANHKPLSMTVFVLWSAVWLEQDVPWRFDRNSVQFGDEMSRWKRKPCAANQRRRADLRVRSLFQAWQLIGSSRKLWYAMANQMSETDQEVARGTRGW